MRLIDFVKYLQSINIIPQDEKAEDVVDELEVTRGANMLGGVTMQPSIILDNALMIQVMLERLKSSTADAS